MSHTKQKIQINAIVYLEPCFIRCLEGEICLRIDRALSSLGELLRLIAHGVMHPYSQRTPLIGLLVFFRRLHPLSNLIDQSMQRIIPKVRIAFGSPHLSMTQGLPNKLKASPGLRGKRRERVT